MTSVTHQFLYTIPLSAIDKSGGFNDVLINYRYQALTEGHGRPAFAPRLSVILPTGSQAANRSRGVVGLQTNMPFSKQVDDFYIHWNAGFTWYPTNDAWPDGARRALFMPTLAASADIGSGGDQRIGSIVGNTAGRGGGLYVEGHAWARLYTSDIKRPVRVEWNKAWHFGGGIYARTSDRFQMDRPSWSTA